MNESEKKLIIKFCHAERLKSSVINMMQILLKFQDHLTYKKEELDGKTILTWFLTALSNDVARAASITQSPYLIEAQNLVTQILQEFAINNQSQNFHEVIEVSRKMLTKITSEAGNVAKDLKF